MRKSIIVAKFIDTDILGEGGRLIFALLDTFVKAGYAILLFDNLTDSTLGKIGSTILQFDYLTVIDKLPTDTEDKIFLYDQATNGDVQRSWLKTARVNFDIFSPYRNSSPLLFPYPIHPVHINRHCLARLPDYRHYSKNVRLFFSGDMKGYTKNHIQYPEPKLPRAEVVDTVRQALPDKMLFLEDAQEADRLFAGIYLNKCVIIDTDKTWIDDRFWLDYLAKTDFFLAPPGIVMPMCHNIIEAMAVGAIPVTNYPEWFNPNLEHLQTCIAFSNKQDLIDKVKLVLNMDQAQISTLRENVINYYEKYLTPTRFIDDFKAHTEHHIDILMITERYVVKNAKKLNRNSFIIHGAAFQQCSPWHGFLRKFANMLNRIRS